MTRSLDVLVVGAGPSGLFAAIELARHGIHARLVERAPEAHRQARATALQPGTLEILARAGVVDQVLAASVHLPYARVFDQDLDLVSELAFAGAGCRWEYQCSLPQWRTEQILADRLRDLGTTVERGVTARAVQAGEDGIVVALTRAGGETETVEVRYLIGAGGAQSITRTSMAQELLGETYPGTALVADVRLRCDIPRDNSALVAAPPGYVLLAALPHGRWITFIGDLAEDEQVRLTEDVSRESVAAAMKRRIRGEISLEDVAWTALFRMHNRIATRLAGPRRFLLGDAGHLSSPFGGEGLNSGLHDAHNLGWKLALTLQGRARPRLLETFASERLAANRHALVVSDRLHAMAHAAVDSARTGMRPPPPTPEQVAALVRSRSMLDVSYADSPIVGQYPAAAKPSAGEIRPGDRCPDQIAPTVCHQLLLTGPADAPGLDRLRDRWHGLVEITDAAGAGWRSSADAVLVRPDGHLGFRAASADPPGLAALDEHLESYLHGAATSPVDQSSAG